MNLSDADISNIRAEFPMLAHTMHGKPLVYLDTAATAHKPASVIEAVRKFYAEQYGTVHRAVYELAGQATAHYNAVRHQVKNFLNAQAVEEIIFTKGTTEAINLVASTFGHAFLKPGDEIIISTMEHHSNIVPWQIICQQRGCILKAIPIDERGQLILDAYEKLLSERTKLVSVAHIANSTGTVNPIAEIIKLAHAKGAKVFIDGAQSAPHIKVDVQHLDADFFAFSGHKVYGPTGIGVLYGKMELLEQMPPYQGGSDMIDQVTLPATTYQKPPLKFEAGTPMIAEVIGLGAALTFLEAIGLNRIQAWEQHLLQQATHKLQEIKALRIIGTADQKGAIITFAIKDAHPLDIGTLLDIRGLAVRTGHLCAQPTLHHFGLPAATRISFGIYNTPREIEILVTELQEVISLLNKSY